MSQLASLRGMLTLGYGLEWWASAAIILAYVFITIYFWHDPEGTAPHLALQLLFLLLLTSCVQSRALSSCWG